MKSIRYLLDENVPPALRAALHRLYPEMTVWLIGDPGAPERGTLDPEILIWCELHSFSLVTNNRASMPMHLQAHTAAGRQVPGIFVLNPQLSLGQTAEDLAIIYGASEATEYRNQLRYLPLSL
jgi:hypothetical protein